MLLREAGERVGAGLGDVQSEVTEDQRPTAGSVSCGAGQIAQGRGRKEDPDPSGTPFPEKSHSVLLAGTHTALYIQHGGCGGFKAQPEPRWRHPRPNAGVQSRGPGAALAASTSKSRKRENQERGKCPEKPRGNAPHPYPAPCSNHSETLVGRGLR